VDGGCAPDVEGCFDDLAESASYNDYVSTCTAQLTDCGLGEEALEEVCEIQIFKLLSEEILGAIVDCFAEPCPQIQPCVQDVFDDLDLPGV
jgi:hypothetical protein